MFTCITGLFVFDCNRKKLLYSVTHIYLSLAKHNNKTGETGSQKLTINNFYYHTILLYNAISYYLSIQIDKYEIKSSCYCSRTFSPGC